MSQMKRIFESYLETLSDIDLFDCLVDLGWNEDEVLEIIDCRHK